jgi:hypothetical protein
VFWSIISEKCTYSTVVDFIPRALLALPDFVQSSDTQYIFLFLFVQIYIYQRIRNVENPPCGKNTLTGKNSGDVIPYLRLIAST